jgi:hypothetical protein
MIVMVCYDFCFLLFERGKRHLCGAYNFLPKMRSAMGSGFFSFQWYSFLGTLYHGNCPLHPGSCIGGILQHQVVLIPIWDIYDVSRLVGLLSGHRHIYLF